MPRDIERGAVTEGEHMVGDMVVRARGLGIATPILDLARTHVAAYETSRRDVISRSSPARVRLLSRVQAFPD
jgi:ketopantoate reductase